MIRLGRTAIITCLICVAAVAQTAEDEIQSKLAAVRYASIAELARIEGDVHLVLSGGGVVTVVSGHPLLAPMAVESAKAIGSLQGQADIDLTYHFILVDTVSVPTSSIVKRGNAFERAILRLFGFKTEKVVHDYRCESGVPPANIVKPKGAALEIWVFGRTRCFETNTAAFMAER